MRWRENKVSEVKNKSVYANMRRLFVRFIWEVPFNLTENKTFKINIDKNRKQVYF